MAYKRMGDVAKDATEAKIEAQLPALTEADSETALKALLAFAGSPSAAREALIHQYGIDAPEKELVKLRDVTHAERYSALQTQYAADIEEAMIRELRELARAAMHGERLGIENAVKALPKLPPIPAAQVALNLSKIKQTNIDKLLALTGRPTTITETRSAADLLRALAAKGVVELEAGDPDES